MSESILPSGNLKIVLTFKGIPVKIELSRFYCSYKNLELFCGFFQHFSTEPQLINCDSAGTSPLNNTPIAVFAQSICMFTFIFQPSFLLMFLNSLNIWPKKVLFWDSKHQIHPLYANCWGWEWINDDIPSFFLLPMLRFVWGFVSVLSFLTNMFSVKCQFCHKGCSSVLWLQLCSIA